MERKIRKLQNNLLISGYAVIAFGLWSILKAVFYVFLKPEYFDDMFEWAELAEFGELGRKVAYFIIFFALVVDTLLRLFVGRRAIKESKGKKVSAFYLLVTAVLMAFSAGSLVTLFSPDNYSFSITDTIVSGVVELTALFIFCDLFYSSVTVRKLRKKGGGKDAA